jgi:hypothetical protein
MEVLEQRVVVAPLEAGSEKTQVTIVDTPDSRETSDEVFPVSTLDTRDMVDESLVSKSVEHIKKLQAEGYELPTWRLTIIICWLVYSLYPFCMNSEVQTVFVWGSACPLWTSP